MFLKYYFGSLSIIHDNTKPNKPVEPEVDPDAEWWNSLKGLSALDRFIRIFLDQLRKIFEGYDLNHNLQFEQDEIEAILTHVFKLDENELKVIMMEHFNLKNKNTDGITFEQLVRILLEVYFTYVWLKRKFSDFGTGEWKVRKISLAEFIELFALACHFLRKRHSKEDLTEIFGILDTDKDGYITFSQFVDFIKKYLGLGLPEPEQPKPLPPADNGDNQKPGFVSPEEWGFI